MITKIIELILKVIGMFWSKIKTVEFERDQREKTNDAERRIRDAVDNVKPTLPPSVSDGKVEDRNDDDVFNNKDWNKK